ncbi:hypothetical protein GW17_00049586 [Ensete ventricosum]|nr:hypothetical protein GW17_00049586 [Ensete ventricosum]
MASGDMGRVSRPIHLRHIVCYLPIATCVHPYHTGLRVSSWRARSSTIVDASLSKWSTWQLYEVIGVEADLIGEIPRCCLYIQGGTLSQARQSEPPRGSRDELRCPLVSLEILHKCLR